MNEMTLREVCELVRVTRRVIQGYEKLEMVQAMGRNKYGHLLYNADAVERIIHIKMYRNLGFSVKETKEIMEANDEMRKQMVRGRLSQMREELDELERQIEIAEGLLQ